MRTEIPKDFRYIPSFPNYCVDRLGQTVVRVYDDGSTHVVTSNSKGNVCLFQNGKRYCKSPTQLMREAWFGKELKNGKFTVSVSALNVSEGSTEWVKFDSLSDASKATGIPVKYISEIINTEVHHTYHGWAFRKEDR